MDNLTSHKVQGVAELIAAAGASVVYLPPYSPIAAALGLVSQADISGWYAKDGYGIQSGIQQ
jgi:hypothetical protein